MFRRVAETTEGQTAREAAPAGSEGALDHAPAFALRIKNGAGPGTGPLTGSRQECYGPGQNLGDRQVGLVESMPDRAPLDQ